MSAGGSEAEGNAAMAGVLLHEEGKHKCASVEKEAAEKFAKSHDPQLQPLRHDDESQFWEAVAAWSKELLSLGEGAWLPLPVLKRASKVLVTLFALICCVGVSVVALGVLEWGTV